MALLLLLATVVSLGLIASGAFDPRPYGREIWREDKTSMVVPAKTRHLIWLDVAAPTEVYSLRLTASLREGDRDVGYGLAVGDDRRFLAVMVSPLGYVAMCYDGAEASQPHGVTPDCPLPWQTWPHVRSGNGSNEIWLDVEGDKINVHINREQLWQGDVGELGNRLGWIGESFAGRAMIDNYTIQLFGG